MEKSKSIRSGDRLSKLPDSLIFHIFWLLPIIDVVRTTILSKRWRNLWTKSPFLSFDQCAIYPRHYGIDGFQDLEGFRNFVNRVLILWRGVRVVKFKIKLDFDFTQSLVKDIGVWLRFAKEKQVEELDIELLTQDDDDYDLDFECLYSCSSLKVLRLKGCRYEIVGNVKLDRLKNLILYGNCLNQSAITKVLDGSPKLEVLIWTSFDSFENLCIRSSSLKTFSIDKYFDCYYDIPRRKELKIRTPNLSKLEISGPPYEKFLLNVSSLSDLTLRFCGPSRCTAGDLDRFLEESLKQILPTIQRIDRVTLSDWCVKVLGDMNKKCLLSPLFNVKFLKLNVRYSEYVRIAGLLRIFPELKRLVIEDENKNDYLKQRELLEFEAHPNSFLMQLRTVDVTWAKGGYAIFSFIEIILKYASKLEKMVFRVKTTFDITVRYSVSQKLLTMARSSPTAQLVFCEY